MSTGIPRSMVAELCFILFVFGVILQLGNVMENTYFRQIVAKIGLAFMLLAIFTIVIGIFLNL